MTATYSYEQSSNPRAQRPSVLSTSCQYSVFTRCLAVGEMYVTGSILFQFYSLNLANRDVLFISSGILYGY